MFSGLFAMYQFVAKHIANITRFVTQGKVEIRAVCSADSASFRGLGLLQSQPTY